MIWGWNYLITRSLHLNHHSTNLFARGVAVCLFGSSFTRMLFSSDDTVLLLLLCEFSSIFLHLLYKLQMLFCLCFSCITWQLLLFTSCCCKMTTRRRGREMKQTIVCTYPDSFLRISIWFRLKYLWHTDMYSCDMWFAKITASRELLSSLHPPLEIQSISCLLHEKFEELSVWLCVCWQWVLIRMISKSEPECSYLTNSSTQFWDHILQLVVFCFC